MDLLPMVDHYRVSESASSFVTHMHELHEVIKDKIKQKQLWLRLGADTRRKFKTFDVDDFVMVWIRPKRFPLGIVKKLHARCVGLFKILTKLNDNVYDIDLPEDFKINHVSNIEDLMEYKGPNFNPNNSLLMSYPWAIFWETPTSPTLRYYS